MAFCKIQIVGFGSPGRSRVPARIYPADSAKMPAL